MKNETKQAPDNTSEVKPEFLQAEPEQISDVELRNIAGGAVCECYRSTQE